MVKISVPREYMELTADDCFNRAVTALSQSGYEIFKKRDFAWLVIGKMTTSDGSLEANITARPAGGKASVATFSLSSDSIAEGALNEFAEKLIHNFESINK